MAEPSAERRALLARPELQDTDPNTRTFRSFVRRGFGNNPHILAIASNTGANQVLEKVVEGLPKSVDVTVISHVRDAEVFKNKHGLIEASGISPAQRIADSRPDVGIAGFATEPHAEMAMTLGAEYPTAWIQDSPQSSIDFYRKKLTGTWSTPNHLFAVSQFGYQQEAEAFYQLVSNGYNPRKLNLVVTGDPRDERYASWDIAGTRSKARDHFGIPEERRVILYMGVPGSSSPEVMKWISDASVKTGKENHQIVYGRHPREDGKTAEEKALRVQAYGAASKRLSRFNGLIDASSFNPAEIGLEGSKADVLIQMSDLAVTTISSTAEQAMRAGIASGQVLAKDILAGTEVPDFEATPEILAGAIVNIQSQGDMTCLFRGLENTEYMRDLQRNMNKYKPEPGATQAVVGLLLEIADKYRGQRNQGLYT